LIIILPIRWQGRLPIPTSGRRDAAPLAQGSVALAVPVVARNPPSQGVPAKARPDLVQGAFETAIAGAVHGARQRLLEQVRLVGIGRSEAADPEPDQADRPAHLDVLTEGGLLRERLARARLAHPVGGDASGLLAVSPTAARMASLMRRPMASGGPSSGSNRPVGAGVVLVPPHHPQPPAPIRTGLRLSGVARLERKMARRGGEG
jgi:hypothetical protein